MDGAVQDILSESEFMERLETFRLPRYEEVPEIELYMDQLITYVGSQVAFLPSSGEKPLTSSMVNNYVKQRLVPQPKNKRYVRVHVVYLIAVCVLKRSFSISDIERLVALEVRHRYQIPEAYDFFCTAFEESLRVLFLGHTNVEYLGDLKMAEQSGTFSILLENAHDADPDRLVAIAAATSAASKVYVDARLSWLEQAREQSDAAVDEARRLQEDTAGAGEGKSGKKKAEKRDAAPGASR